MKMAKRKVNLTLPEELWAKLRSRVPERKLSQYVAEATAARLAEEEWARLRERLKEQYLARAAQDLELAGEFFAPEQEASDRIEA
jgi:metal-responsive CopG/Arc/MetJ family transcriptional regulator